MTNGREVYLDPDVVRQSLASRNEVVARHTAPLLLAAIEAAPVRFIPTAFGRHFVLSRVSKWTFQHSVFSERTDDLAQELQARGESTRFGSMQEMGAIAVVGARDCYWLGASAMSVMRRNGVPKVQRAERLAASTDLLLHSYGPQQPIIFRRTIKPTDNWGRWRIKRAKLEARDDGRVRLTQATRDAVRAFKAREPYSGCPAHGVPTAETPSSVVAYWRTYVDKVFTPWGKPRGQKIDC